MNWNTMTKSLPAHALREVTLVLAKPADLEAVNAALELMPFGYSPPYPDNDSEPSHSYG